MLAGTSRVPGEVVAEKVPPKGGMATIEKIAINAVMAGAKPEYLPVIIAAMEVLTDKNYNTNHLQTSTSGPTPVIFVNGPIATELGINSGVGLLGYGWRPNATIGRAIRLCLINFGHAWPGVNDMAQMGKWAPFGNWTFAENESESSWKPFHVDLGFKPEDSTVTASTSNFTKQGPGGASTPQTTYECLVFLADVLRITEYPSRAFITKVDGVDVLIGMSPSLAHRLAQMGFSNTDIKEWRYDHSRIPYSELTETEKKDFERSLANRSLPMRFFLMDSKDTKGIVPGIPVVTDPNSIRIVVAGGDPGYASIWKYDKIGQGTRLIPGATLTKAGR
jgi:hypothetical protein